MESFASGPTESGGEGGKSFKRRKRSKSAQARGVEVLTLVSSWSRVAGVLYLYYRYALILLCLHVSCHTAFVYGPRHIPWSRRESRRHLCARREYSECGVPCTTFGVAPAVAASPGANYLAGKVTLTPVIVADRLSAIQSQTDHISVVHVAPSPALLSSSLRTPVLQVNQVLHSLEHFDPRPSRLRI